MSTIATWNVNSVNARLPNVLAWLGEVKPDIVLLQEIKCLDAAFPTEAVGELGYNVATHGQKSYNGVAILSRQPIEDVTRGLPGGDGDEQARYLEATIGGLRVASIYLPNGNDVGTDKFIYKLHWMKRLYQHIGLLLERNEAFVFGGDYNVIPADIDARDPGSWKNKNDALIHPDSRRAFRALLHLGLTDAYRAMHPDEAGAYTFWDYQKGAFALDNGIRIDHLLLSPLAADRLLACSIDKAPRRLPKASDHTPVMVELED